MESEKLWTVGPSAQESRAIVKKLKYVQLNLHNCLSSTYFRIMYVCMYVCMCARARVHAWNISDRRNSDYCL